MRLETVTSTAIEVRSGCVQVQMPFVPRRRHACRHRSALQSAASFLLPDISPTSDLFPLDLIRRFARDVEYDASDPFDFVDDAIGDAGEYVVRCSLTQSAFRRSCAG